MTGQANTNAVRHGVHSERRIRPLARSKKRAFLRRNGLLASRLSGPQLAHLNRWSRLEAMADLANRWLDEHGLLNDDGEPQPVVKFVVSVENAGRLAMRALEESLRHSAKGEDELSAYLARAYPEGRDDDD